MMGSGNPPKQLWIRANSGNLPPVMSRPEGKRAYYCQIFNVQVIAMQCPVCHGRNTGKIGANQYYCWHCLLEFSFSPQHEPQVFYIEEDGSLIPTNLESDHKKSSQTYK